MPGNEWSYLLFESAFLCGVISFAWSKDTIRDALSRRFWLPAIGIFMLWVAIDQVAVRVGVWYFPAHGTLHYRWLGFPVEEYLSFLGHTVLTCLVLRTIQRNDKSSREGN